MKLVDREFSPVTLLECPRDRALWARFSVPTVQRKSFEDSGFVGVGFC